MRLASAPLEWPVTPMRLASTKGSVAIIWTASYMPLALFPGSHQVPLGRFSELPWPYMSMDSTTKPRRAYST